VKTWGISGYPAVVLFNEGKGYMISNGYTTLGRFRKAGS
jgi:protein-disulfide isomerase-like protein with CxxC motif